MHLSRSHSSGRSITADGALAITDADGVNGTIIVSSTTGTKAATFSWSTPVASAGGPKFQIYCAARSGGAYTVACTYGGTAGVVTIDAQHECPQFARIGSTLFCIALGGATFA